MPIQTWSATLPGFIAEMMPNVNPMTIDTISAHIARLAVALIPREIKELTLVPVYCMDSPKSPLSKLPIYFAY